MPGCAGFFCILKGGKNIGKKVIIIAFVLVAFGLGDLYAASVTLGPNLKIPPYYKAGSNRCRPGKGYVFRPEAPNYPSSYPKLNLRVFNGEVISFLFEADAIDGWKPWYNQEEGKTVSHRGGTPHYSQDIFIKKGPTAAECKASKGPYGK